VPDDKMNEVSLGIEFLCPGDKPLSAYPKMYEVGMRLLADLRQRYAVPSENVIGHKEWSSTGKKDPLDDMDKIRADVDAILTPEPEPEPEPEPPIVIPPEVIVKLVDYKYNGKPSGTQTAGTAFIDIQNGAYTPPGDGFLLSMLYVNAKYRLKTGATNADIRVRAVRSPFKGQAADNTGYQDFAVPKATTNGDEFLITHLWFESCEGGRKIQWQLDRSADMSSCVLGTRYTKWFWISWDLFKIVESLMKAQGRSAEEIPEQVAHAFADLVFAPDAADDDTEPAS
jgi:hypothetical protein